MADRAKSGEGIKSGRSRPAPLGHASIGVSCFDRVLRKLSFLILIISICLSLAPQVVNAQDNSQPENQVKHQDSAPLADPDQTYFFAFLQENQSGTDGPLLEMLKDKPLIRDLIRPRSSIERKFRPMQQWRIWADKRQRFIPSFGFLCLIGFISWWIFPSLLQSAAEECRKSFWKSFGAGLLISMIVMTVIRAAFLTQIAWPLAIVMIGLSEGAMLIGLSLSIYNLGHAVSLITQTNKIGFFAKNPSWARAFDIVTGAALSSFILIIPAFASFPRCGTRLMALFAVLGIGAIYKELKRRRQQPLP